MTGWQIAMWFASGNGWLEGAEPQERLSDPDAVVDAARSAGRSGARVGRALWMSIRKPPATLAEPNVVTLDAGALVHRVHDRNYGANAFNPCKGSPTRFAPVYDAAGDCVPSSLCVRHAGSGNT